MDPGDGLRDDPVGALWKSWTGEEEGSRGSGGWLGDNLGWGPEKELGDPLGLASCGVGGLVHLNGSWRTRNWHLL